MEKLRSYLEGKRKGEFATTIGVPASYLSQILSGHRTPGLELAIKIETATDGHVTVYDWLDRDAPLSGAA